MKKICLKREAKNKKEAWLNRYDFAYAGRDSVNTHLNTLKSIAPGLIQYATNQIYKVVEKRIVQAMNQRGKHPQPKPMRVLTISKQMKGKSVLS